MRYLFAVLISLAIAATCSLAEAQFEIGTDSGSEPEFTSSVTCAKCHHDIFNYWKESLHAQAVDDHIFQAAFMVAIKERGDEARGLCLGCHAPTTAVTSDITAEKAITEEAVTCDFCHRISDVDSKGDAFAVTLTSGDEKYGPLKPSAKSEKRGHPAVQSDLFTDSKICAVCHQWNNEHGVAIFDTYEEWRKGPYAKKGVHCQNCHMPLVEGSLVRGKGRASGEKINSHNLSGGHSIVQVASSATVRIASVKPVPGGLHAIVEVANTGSGHMIPTGIPSRSLVLDVQLLDASGKVVETASHEFRKIVVDENHAELTKDADIILNGAGISKDNRIPPGETAEVPFHFAASSKKKYLVRATLSYRYSPLILKEEEINIEMGSDVMSP
jgi:RNase P subunit RPR2